MTQIQGIMADSAEEPQILTEFVRKHYRNFLHKQLEENVRTWYQLLKHENLRENKFADGSRFMLLLSSHIRECTTTLEQRAIMTCRLTKLYQRAMLKMIAGVRRETNQNRLVEYLQESILNDSSNIYSSPYRTTTNGYRHATTQTDEADINEADNQIMPITSLVRAPLERLDNNRNIKATIKLNLKQECDTIGQELARLFNENASDAGGEQDEFDNFFGNNGIEDDVTDDPQMLSILEEIQNAPSPREQEDCSAINSSPELCTPAPSIPPTNSYTQFDLRRSLWPCELFMQRRRLERVLSCSDDFRFQARVQSKFNELFGEDSDDEWTTISPSIELDSILVNSCIRRITPWLIKYLTKALKDGLIANRFLFKKLAKRLACVIIAENQYPDKCFIKYQVEDFFCKNGKIDTLTDIENALTLPDFYHYVE